MNFFQDYKSYTHFRYKNEYMQNFQTHSSNILADQLQILLSYVEIDFKKSLGGHILTSLHKSLTSFVHKILLLIAN